MGAVGGRDRGAGAGRWRHGLLWVGAVFGMLIIGALSGQARVFLGRGGGGVRGLWERALGRDVVYEAPILVNGQEGSVCVLGAREESSRALGRFRREAEDAGQGAGGEGSGYRIWNTRTGGVGRYGQERFLMFGFERGVGPETVAVVVNMRGPSGTPDDRGSPVRPAGGMTCTWSGLNRDTGAALWVWEGPRGGVHTGEAMGQHLAAEGWEEALGGWAGGGVYMRGKDICVLSGVDGEAGCGRICLLHKRLGGR